MKRRVSIAMLGTCVACGPRVGDDPPDTVCENLPMLEEAEVHTLELPPSGDGAPVIATLREYTGQRWVEAFATGDVDGDGNRDVVVAVDALAVDCEGRQYLRVFLGTDEDTLTSGPAIPLSATGTSPPPTTPQLAAHDIDGDQRAEVMVYEDIDPPGSNEIRILTVRDDSIELRDTLDFGEGREPSILAIGDFDDNGTTDFFVAFSPTLYVDVVVGCGPPATFVLNVADPSGRVEVPVPGHQGTGHALAVRTDGDRDAVLTRADCQAELSELSVDSQREVEVAPVSFDDPDFGFPTGIATNLNADGLSDLVLRPSADRLLIRITPDDTLRPLRPSATSQEPRGYVLHGVVAVAGAVYMVAQTLGLEDSNAVLFVPFEGDGFSDEAVGSFDLSNTFGSDGSLATRLLDPIPQETVFFRIRAESDSQATDLWHLAVHGKQ